MSKIIILTEEEARAIALVLRSTWITPDLQNLIYNLISRIEKELGD